MARSLPWPSWPCTLQRPLTLHTPWFLSSQASLEWGRFCREMGARSPQHPRGQGSPALRADPTSGVGGGHCSRRAPLSPGTPPSFSSGSLTPFEGPEAWRGGRLDIPGSLSCAWAFPPASVPFPVAPPQGPQLGGVPRGSGRSWLAGACRGGWAPRPRGLVLTLHGLATSFPKPDSPSASPFPPREGGDK